MRLFQTHSATLRGLLLCGFTSIVLAHGHEEDADMGISRPTLVHSNATGSEPESYFRHGEHSGLILAHILLMVVGWVFILPLGVMLSISRSRYRLAVQFLFLCVNAVGVLLVTIYNASTPDLYPNNAHHKLGWVLTWTVSAQVVMGIISISAQRNKNIRRAFLPVSAEAIAEHQRIHGLGQSNSFRFSNDSGQGTERNTESLRSQSISSTPSEELPNGQEDDDDDEDEKHSLLAQIQFGTFLLSRISGLLSSRVLRILGLIYDIVDRVILIFGFAALITGLVTYSRLFAGSSVYNGLAHFVKGGVFFWYGILTLGRWAGCFSEIGWAWNLNPSTGNRPSAEFVESLLIFIYGSTNIFLEHLAAWGSEWTAQDLEHLSITVMFFGGGLLGMFIESKQIRDYLNATKQPSHLLYQSYDPQTLEAPKTYKFSMNPVPALIILLLGMMMSSHHQESMVSTMIHKQWGTLLVGAAFARAATYLVFYIAPPTSILPGRPPTELITAFCLMAGGSIFMASARDTVTAIEINGMDSMFVFTVAMGLITFLMAWVILVIAVKGWAVRRENREFGNMGLG